MGLLCLSFPDRAREGCQQKDGETLWSVVKPLHVTWKCGVVGRFEERSETADSILTDRTLAAVETAAIGNTRASR